MTDGKKEDALTSIKDYLEGLDILYNEFGSTIFTYTETLRSLLPGQLDWIEKHLSNWSILLNETSGGRVVSLKIKRPENRHDSSQLNLEMMLPGEILPAKNTLTANIISAGIRKDLALKIAKIIPPPFELQSQKCLFCAGSLDKFFITPPGDVYFVERAHFKKGREFLITAVTEAIQSYSGKVIEIFFNREITSHKSSFVSIIWNLDIAPVERFRISHKLKEAFESASNLQGLFRIREDKIDR